jgi:hypothetical protein
MTSPKDGGSGLEEALACAEGLCAHKPANDRCVGNNPKGVILAAEVRRYQAQAPAIEAVVEAARVIMTAIPVDALHVACVERDELRTKLAQTTEALSVEVNRRMTAESELAELRAKNRDLNIAADWSHENERLLAANITLRAERDALREAVERAKAEAFGEVLERAQIEVNACRHHAQVSKGANKRLHEAAQGVAQVIVYYCQNRLRSLHAAPAASPRRGRSLD